MCSCRSKKGLHEAKGVTRLLYCIWWGLFTAGIVNPFVEAWPSFYNDTEGV